MRKNHGNDLMRKLSGGEPPHPPHDLADRIKKEIPERLTVERGPRGLFGAGREALLVAAMLLVVVGASLVGLHMMEQEERTTSLSEIADVSRGSQSVAPPTSSDLALERLQESAPSNNLKKSQPPTAAAAAPPSADASSDEFAPERRTAPPAPKPVPPVEPRPPALAEAKATKPAPPPSPHVAAVEPALQATTARADHAMPAPAAAAPEIPSSEAGASPTTRVAGMESESNRQKGEITRAKRSFAARAASFAEKSVWRESTEFPSQPLDLAPGDDSLDIARRALDHERLPPPNSIRVEQLVNSLDKERGPGSGDFGIVVEGGPSPTSPDSRDYMMRVVIRARDADQSIRRILARDAVATVEFDPSIVTRYRVLRGDGAEFEPDRRIPGDSYPPVTMAESDRVTSLFEIHFAPELDHRKIFATVVFRYRPEKGGAPVEIRRPVVFGSFSRNWRTAPTGLRFDVLVAEWGEILASSHPESENHSEVGRMVTALAHEQPDDPSVQDLRDLVHKTFRILYARQSRTP